MLSSLRGMCNASEGVKKFKTGGDREAETPAEPHGARAAGVTARREARPPNFSQLLSYLCRTY